MILYYCYPVEFKVANFILEVYWTHEYRSLL